jgi:hypothetical protein
MVVFYIIRNLILGVICSGIFLIVPVVLFFCIEKIKIRITKNTFPVIAFVVFWIYQLLLAYFWKEIGESDSEKIENVNQFYFHVIPMAVGFLASLVYFMHRFNNIRNKTKYKWK